MEYFSGWAHRMTHIRQTFLAKKMLPEGGGGFGLWKLRDSSRVYALNLTWCLFTLSGSMWVVWTHQYSLKCGYLWDVKEGQND